MSVGYFGTQSLYTHKKKKEETTKMLTYNFPFCSAAL